MPARILVVDDEVDLERLLKMRFRKQIKAQEMEFVFAYNGNEALEILSKNRATDIDMVLTDINMPEMDGLTLLTKLGEVYPNMKAIVLSAYGDMNNIRKAMNAGAFDFLTKPINFDDLSITIDKTLKYAKEIRDTIEQLQYTQLQLVQQEKMATLGQLVAGVSHEINNPVTCISGYSSILSLLVPDLIAYVKQDGDKNFSLGEVEAEAEKLRIENILTTLLQMISGISLSADRLMKLGKSLQFFCYNSNLSQVLVDIHEGIDSTLMILQYRLKYSNESAGIRIVNNYGKLPQINCYLGELNQVFMNLIANAIDACEEEYERFMLVNVAKKYVITITTTVSENHQTAIVKIKDNAGGMSEDVKPQIFDHLFTTKPVGKGTGLGLSISRKIVEELHGGSLSCESVLGEGTEFTIALPIVLNSIDCKCDRATAR